MELFVEFTRGFVLKKYNCLERVGKMKIPMNIIDDLIGKRLSQRFDNTFIYNDQKYYYYTNNYLFMTQIYRVYSLLAKELGVNTAEYDYIRKNGINLLYSKSVCDKNEKLVESNYLNENAKQDGYSDYMKLWLEAIEELPFIDKDNSLDDFYKQWFFCLLIFDDDKQISLIRDNQGLYRVGPYFDYGGVYMNQDVYDIDNDIFYDEEAYLKFCSECNYTREKLNKDLDMLIDKHVIKDICWRSQNDKLLSEIFPHLDGDFIERCFSINILDVMDKDVSHYYSPNFRKVVSLMFETSRNLLKQKMTKVKVNKNNKSNPKRF